MLVKWKRREREGRNEGMNMKEKRKMYKIILVNKEITEGCYCCTSCCKIMLFELDFGVGTPDVEGKLRRVERRHTDIFSTYLVY